MIYLLTQILLCLLLAGVLGGALGWLAHRVRSTRHVDALGHALAQRTRELERAESSVSMLTEDFDDLRQRSRQEIETLREGNRQLPILTSNLERSQLMVAQTMKRHEKEVRELAAHKRALETRLATLQARLDAGREPLERGVAGAVGFAATGGGHDGGPPLSSTVTAPTVTTAVGSSAGAVVGAAATAGTDDGADVDHGTDEGADEGIGIVDGTADIDLDAEGVELGDEVFEIDDDLSAELREDADADGPRAHAPERVAVPAAPVPDRTIDANVAGTDVVETDLVETDLVETDLIRADFVRADLGGDPDGAELDGAELDGDPAGADLDEADLPDARGVDVGIVDADDLDEDTLETPAPGPDTVDGNGLRTRAVGPAMLDTSGIATGTPDTQAANDDLDDALDDDFDDGLDDRLDESWIDEEDDSANRTLAIDASLVPPDPEDAPPQAPLFGPVDRQDDLQRIFGIGPSIEKGLNALGITSYSQLAELERHEIEKIADALQIVPERIERHDWVGSARRQLEDVLEEL